MLFRSVVSTIGGLLHEEREQAGYCLKELGLIVRSEIGIRSVLLGSGSSSVL